MTDQRPIDADIRGTGGGQGGGEERRGGDSGVSEEVFKEALSYHAAGVTIVAVRDQEKIHATTVSSFIPVSARPPRVLVSVGGNAQVLPFLREGGRFVVNLLGEGQRKLASVFADSYPVGPSPFRDEGEPEIPDALVSLRCRVESIIDTGGGVLVLGVVEGARVKGGDAALVHYRRRYRSLGSAES